MTNSEKNTVEVRVPRKRDGFKDHKTTVRKRVLPEAKNSPSAGSGKPIDAGPEALGLPPRGPRVQLPTSAPAPVVEPDGYEPATWRFMLLNLEDGQVTFDDANQATAGDYRDEYATTRIANNLSTGQALKFAAENADVLQGILDAYRAGDSESFRPLEHELQTSADELATDGIELERAVDELAEAHREAAARAIAALEADTREWVPDTFEVECEVDIDEDGEPTVTLTVADSEGDTEQFGPFENYDFDDNLAWRRVDSWLEDTWVPERFQQNWDTLKAALSSAANGARTSTAKDSDGDISIQVTGGGQITTWASVDPLKHGVMNQSDFSEITDRIHEEVAGWN